MYSNLDNEHEKDYMEDNAEPVIEGNSESPEEEHLKVQNKDSADTGNLLGETKVTPNTYTEPWRKSTYTEMSDANQPYRNGVANESYQWTTHEPKNKGNKKSGVGSFAKVVCIILACILLSSTAAYGVVEYRIQNGDLNMINQVVLGSDASNNESSDGDTTTPISNTGSSLSSADLYALACEQVVGVNTDVTTNVFGQTSSTAVSGSGFIISTDGYIITNYHVIEYAVEYGYDLTVMLYDGTSYVATIVGYEKDNDVAVIKIDATNLNTVTLGNSSDMSVGETIYAVGNPLGELSYSMTSGIISAQDRLINSDATTTINMFQIDAAVNAGNSGGPVFNSDGEVIGIVTAKYSSTGVEGLGFAIPIDDVVNIVSELIENGYVTGKAYMGIMVDDVNSSAADYYDLVEGAYVKSVESGSCAETAGMRVGDVITALGDTAITSVVTLKAAKKNFSAGDTTTITIYRSGETLNLTITFDEEGNTAAGNTPTEG